MRAVDDEEERLALDARVIWILEIRDPLRNGVGPRRGRNVVGAIYIDGDNRVLHAVAIGELAGELERRVESLAGSRLRRTVVPVVDKEIDAEGTRGGELLLNGARIVVAPASVGLA